LKPKTKEELPAPMNEYEATQVVYIITRIATAKRFLVPMDAADKASNHKIKRRLVTMLMDIEEETIHESPGMQDEYRLPFAKEIAKEFMIEQKLRSAQ